MGGIEDRGDVTTREICVLLLGRAIESPLIILVAAQLWNNHTTTMVMCILIEKVRSSGNHPDFLPLDDNN